VGAKLGGGGVIAHPRLAPDAGLPQRDELLDAGRLAPRLDATLGAEGPAGVARVEVTRVKYRVGRSMTLALRVHLDGAVETVAARAFGEGNAARNFARARRVATDGQGRLRPVTYAEDLETVFWVFPHDRRIESLALLRAPNGDLERLVGARCAPRLVAYAPEKAATARCVDERGRARAYVKVYADEGGARTAAIHRALAASAAPGRLRLPRALAYDGSRRALAIEPIAGDAATPGGLGEHPGGLTALGAALATLHHAAPPEGLDRLERTIPERLDGAAEAIGAVRPDVAAAAISLAGALVSSFDDGEEQVCLHGDAHGKNAILGPGGAALIDLDQVALGPAAADLGSVLAGLRYRRCLGSLSAARERALRADLLRGYASVRGLPSERSLAWHTAAALLGERALRAVTRVRPAGLEKLGALLAAGRWECPRGRRAGIGLARKWDVGRRPTLLMHCQHTVGLGHLTRSLALAAVLADRFSVVLLSGGEIPATVAPPPGVEVVQLPPLARDREGRIVSLDPRRTAERAKVLRRRMIEDAVRDLAPAVVVVELFPFGRRALTGEILTLIEAARGLPGRPALVACSLRDILVGRGAKQAAFDERACRLANSNLDAILVHADPRFARLEESFRPRTPLRVPVHYTGFVSSRRGPTSAPIRRQRRIVVSAGGGNVGEPLLRAALDAQPSLWRDERIAMRAIAGPLLADDVRRELRASAAGRPGLELRSAVPDLRAELRSAAVSVSQCGYNTALDIIRARVPALVVPYRAPGEDEQARRAARLARLGVVRVLDPAALDPAALADEARALVGTEAPAADLDLDGASASAEILEAMVAGAVPAPAGGVPA
jgi:predicted glycosyltransferase